MRALAWLVTYLLAPVASRTHFAVIRAEPLRVGKAVPFWKSAGGAVAPIGGTAVYFPPSGETVRQLPVLASGVIEVMVKPVL